MDLPVSRLWGVGEKTGAILRGLGIQTIGELSRWPEEALCRRLGTVGEQLHRLGRGIDDRPVVPEAMAKSMGAETTFAVDCEDPGRIRQSLLRLAERVSARLRREGLAGSTITVKIRFADFTTLTRALTLPAAVTLTDEIYHPALSLVHKVPLEGRKVRLLGIAVSKLTPKAAPGQMPLFPSDPRRENAARAVDEIRRRFGEAGIVRVNYSNAETGYVVARLEVPGYPGPVTVVGNLWGVTPGEPIRLRGQWVRHARYGEQFKVEAYESILPTSVAAIERYLASGLIRGIGPAFARRLVEPFGPEPLRVIDEEPERLLTVDGIGESRLNRIRAAWTEQQNLRGLILFLQEHQISPTFALRISRAYGPEAPDVIREDPYRLARDVAGIGFKTADRIGVSLGVARDSPKRCAAGLLYLLHEAAEAGHVYYPASRLCQEGLTLLGIRGEELLRETLARLHEEKAVVCESLNGDSAVYLAPLYQAEEGVSLRLALLAKAPRLGPRIDLGRAIQWAETRVGLHFTVGQREALHKALEAKVLIITGGPGTGKTTLLKALIEILEGKRVRLSLAAPTGRAAKRMAEATGREAKTIHRLLEFAPKERRFKRNEFSPLAVDLVGVDEASMVDLVLMDQLLRALPPMAALILLGDCDQLPPRRPGSLLHDVIASASVPVVRLTEIFRQAKESHIVVNAHRVNRGEFPHLTP